MRGRKLSYWHDDHVIPWTHVFRSWYGARPTATTGSLQLTQQNVTEVHQFLDLASYYQHYIQILQHVFML